MWNKKKTLGWKHSYNKSVIADITTAQMSLLGMALYHHNLILLPFRVFVIPFGCMSAHIQS